MPHVNRSGAVPEYGECVFVLRSRLPALLAVLYYLAFCKIPSMPCLGGCIALVDVARKSCMSVLVAVHGLGVSVAAATGDGLP